MFNFSNMFGGQDASAAPQGIKRSKASFLGNNTPDKMKNAGGLMSGINSAMNRPPQQPQGMGMQSPAFTPTFMPNFGDATNQPQADFGGIFSRLGRMGGNTGITGGMGMQTPGIQNFRNQISSDAGYAPPSGGFNFPMMRF